MKRPFTFRGFVLVAALPLVFTGSAWSQSSASLGNNNFEINNPEGQVFEIGSFVPLSLVIVGEGGGPDVDFLIKDPSSDVNADSLYFNASNSNLTLGSGSALEAGDDGDLILLDTAGNTTIRLSGDSNGRATQPISGNGFVKAWVRVDGYNGAVLSSYNVSAVERTATGVYFVTFNPTSLNERPILATIDGHNNTPSNGGISVGLDDGFHTGSKQVNTFNSDGAVADRSFNLVVY